MEIRQEAIRTENVRSFANSSPIEQQAVDLNLLELGGITEVPFMRAL